MTLHACVLCHTGYDDALSFLQSDNIQNINNIDLLYKRKNRIQLRDTEKKIDIAGFIPTMMLEHLEISHYNATVLQKNYKRIHKLNSHPGVSRFPQYYPKGFFKYISELFVKSILIMSLSKAFSNLTFQILCLFC